MSSEDLEWMSRLTNPCSRDGRTKSDEHTLPSGYSVEFVVRQRSAFCLRSKTEVQQPWSPSLRNVFYLDRVYSQMNGVLTSTFRTSDKTILISQWIILRISWIRKRAHTQNIESLWNKAKRRNRKQAGTHRSLLDSYMCEFMWRCRCERQNLNPFDAIMQDIAAFWPPS